MVFQTFFNLPDHLKMHILDVWLALPNIQNKNGDFCVHFLEAVKFNSVVLNELDRLLQAPEGVFQCAVDDIYGKKVFWMLRYHMKGSNMILYQEHMRPDSAAILGNWLRKLRLELQRGEENTAYIPSDIWLANVYHLQNEELLYELLEHCPHLQVLHLTCHRGYSGQAWRVCLSDRFASVFSNCAKLTEVSLQCCVDISSAIVTAMCAAPNLTEITIAHGSSFAVDALQGEKHTNYRVRKVVSNDFSFCALFSNLQNVQVSTSEYTNVVDFANTCKRVQTASFHFDASLRLDNSTNATTTEKICEYWKSMRRLTMNVSDEAVGMIVMKMKSLETFLCDEYDGCSALYNAVPPLCTYPLHYEGSRLRAITLRGCNATTLQIIIQHCHYLYSFHIAASWGKEDRSALNALELLNDTSVKYLRINGGYQLTNAHVSKLRTLETIVLVSAHLITSDGLLQMVKQCTSLRKLHVVELTRVHVEVCYDLLQARPSLHVLTFKYGNMFDEKVNEMNKLTNKLVKQLFPNILSFAIC